MRSASSKTLFLLSAAAAFGVLAWSAQGVPQTPRLVSFIVAPPPGVTVTAGPAGQGFFGRVPRGNIVVGVDSVVGAGRKAVCTSVTWSRGKPTHVTVAPCPQTP